MTKTDEPSIGAVVAPAAAPGRGSPAHVLSAPAAVALLFALLLLSRPYGGIRHDSVLYFGQALRILLPDEFARDLFFEHGSQASFTLFPQIMAWFLRWGTPAQVSMALVAAGLLCFLLASAFLARQLLEPKLAYASLIVLVALPGGYGAFNVFNYAEPFATARSFAEPLSLLSLAMLVCNRLLPATLLVAVALVLHPLQAISSVLVGWCWLIIKSRRWAHLAWLGLLIAALTVFRVGPFAALALQFDSQWKEWISEPNRHVFLMRWPLLAWCQVLVDVLMLAIAAKLLAGRARQFAQAVLLALVIGFAFTLVLADIGELVLPTGIQAWRVHWIAHWTALVLTPPVIVTLWARGSEVARGQAILLAGTVLLGAPAGLYSTAYAAPLSAALFVAWPWLVLRLRQPVRLAALAGVVAAVVIGYVRFAVPVAKGPAGVAETIGVLLLHPVPMAVTIAVTVFVVRQLSSERALNVARGTLAAAAGALLVAAVLHWDHRSNWSRYMEGFSVTTSQLPFGVRLPPSSQVYWINELLAPWLVLHRPSYWNGLQEAGLLFNRGTAEEAARRSRVLAVMELQGTVCGLVNDLEGGQRCQPDDDTVQLICDKAARALDFVVLPYRLSQQAIGSWAIPPRVSREKAVTYYLYACSASAGSAGPYR